MRPIPAVTTFKQDHRYSLGYSSEFSVLLQKCKKLLLEKGEIKNNNINETIVYIVNEWAKKNL